MIGIYFRVSSEEDKAEISNAIHNYLFNTLGSLKVDRKTRFFITHANISVNEVVSTIKGIASKKVTVFAFEIDNWTLYADQKLIDFIKND